MGFSTPKTPFNLAEFLSQKGSPRNSRKPMWKRRSLVQEEESPAEAATVEKPEEE